MWKKNFFMFRRLKNNVTCYFYKQHFYKGHSLKYQKEPKEK